MNSALIFIGCFVSVVAVTFGVVALISFFGRATTMGGMIRRLFLLVLAGAGVAILFATAAESQMPICWPGACAHTTSEATTVYGSIDVAGWPPGLWLGDWVVAVADAPFDKPVWTTKGDLALDTSGPEQSVDFAAIFESGLVPPGSGSLMVMVGVWIWWAPMQPPMPHAWFGWVTL